MMMMINSFASRSTLWRCPLVHLDVAVDDVAAVQVCEALEGLRTRQAGSSYLSADPLLIVHHNIGWSITSIALAASLGRSVAH